MWLANKATTIVESGLDKSDNAKLRGTMMWALLSCIKIFDGGDIFLTQAEADKAHKLGNYYLGCYSPLSKARPRNATSTSRPCPISLLAPTFTRALLYRIIPPRLSQPPSSAPPSCHWVMICQSDAPLARGWRVRDWPAMRL